MSLTTEAEGWAARIVKDPAFRNAELRRAGLVESVSALLAAVLAMVAVWGFTAGGVTVGGIGAATIGGLATLSFATLMVIAAGCGMRRRLIHLAVELGASARS
ncbi:MAG TPA: hypothetical protein VJU18_17660 [Vicinamibacteria bacterium]|nr:hypothetical protein [Vicinamibacteria bacterium]